MEYSTQFRQNHPLDNYRSASEKLKVEAEKFTEKILRNKNSVKRLFEEGKSENFRQKNPDLYTKLIQKQHEKLKQVSDEDPTNYRFAGLIKLKTKKPKNVFEESEKSKMERQAPKRVKYTRKDKYKSDITKLKDLKSSPELSHQMDAITSIMRFEEEKGKMEYERSKYLNGEKGLVAMKEANIRLISNVQAKLELIKQIT